MALQHKDLPPEHAHTPFAWIVADETERLALTVTADQVGKRLWQKGDDTEYTLKSADPVQWVIAAPVQSVHGRTGAVTAQTGDYTPEQVGADPSGTASTAVTTHEEAADPHSQYVQKATGKGLSTEDYTTAEQSKLTDIEFEATKNATDAQLRDRETHTGTQPANTVTGLATVATSGKYSDLTGKPDLSALEEVKAYPAQADFPATGETQKVYIATDTGYMYRWSGSEYAQLTDQTAIWGQISGNLADQTDLSGALAQKLSDAPVDGQQYARKDGAWSPVEASGGTTTIVVTQTLTAPAEAGEQGKYTIEASATSLLSGGSIESFVVAWWDGATETVPATAGEATLEKAVDVAAGGTVSATVYAVDNLGNKSKAETVSAGVVANNPPQGPITISAPTQTGKNSTFQVSFTGATDADGHTVVYRIHDDGGFVFADTDGIQDGEIVDVTAPDVDNDTDYTFQVVAEDQYGAESAAYSATVTVLAAQVIGVALRATGGPGGTWDHVDEAGNTIATPSASYFNGHPIWGGIGDVVVDGQDMVEIPKFYWKRGTAGGDSAWWISDQPLTGFSVMPAFVLDGTEVDAIQVGKYQASESGGKMQSIPGVLPWVDMTIGTAITNAEARNVSGVAGFRLWHYDMWLAIQWLYLIENASMDSQTVTGEGRVNESEAANVDAADVAQATYRGVVGLWGNVRQWMDGARTLNGVIERRDYNGSWTSTGESVPNGGSTQYPITFRPTGDESWIANTFSTSNDNTATLPDYRRWRDGGEYYPFVGGNWSNGASAGLWSVNCYYDSSDAYPLIGARLARVA